MGSQESSSGLMVKPPLSLAVVEADVHIRPGLDLAELRRVSYRHGHPFMGGWIPNRLDMGFDGTFHGHLYTPVDCEVIYAGLFNGWHGSHGVIIRSLHDLGEDVPTNCLYFTEGIHPIVRNGEHIKLGRPLGVAAHSPYGDSYGHGSLGAIEWGVAAFGTGGYQTNPYAMTLGVGSREARDMVLRFARWTEEVLGVHGPTDTKDAGRP